MVDHTQLRRQNLKNRQAPNVPHVSGINQSSSIVVAASAATGASLALDTTASAVPTESVAVPLAGSETVVLTSTVAMSTTRASATSSSTANSAGATNILPMKTVIASCIGTLAGVVLLIIIGLALYRRYMRSLKNSHTSSKNRNATREVERRRSHVEPWSKMGDEKSGGLQVKAVNGEVPMDKMFKTSPSIRTAYTHKSDEQMTMEMPQSLAQYHPDLASKSSEAVTVHRPFLGRADSGPTIGWDADKDVGSQQISAGSAENSPSIAIPTPVATRTLHRWQSAEVINPDAEEGPNPFETEAEQRKSRGNPFFKGTDYSHMRTRSSSITSLKTIKTKERSSRAPSVASNATGATDATFMPNLPFIHHAPSGSREEALNNPHAIRTLIRALDVTEQEIQDRLRVVSMQPSVLTMESMYTEEEDATPMPSPVGDRHNTRRQ